MDKINKIKTHILNILFVILIYILTFTIFKKCHYTYYINIPLFLLLIILTKGDLRYIVILLLLGVGGAITELLMIKFANRPWVYSERENKTVVGGFHIDKYIPLWLPILWSLASGFSIEIYKNMYPLLNFVKI